MMNFLSADSMGAYDFLNQIFKPLLLDSQLWECVHPEILFLKDNHTDQVDAPPRWRKGCGSWLASSISKIHDSLKG